MTNLFWNFTLPNAATWFYFAAFLAVALFFQFSRVLALRNFDLLALFLFVPGFLLIGEANLQAATGIRNTPVRYAGYGWLLMASLYWFARCLADLAATRRPRVSPNLNPAGLIWFASVLFLGLVAVAFSRDPDPWRSVGRRPAVLAGIQDGAAEALLQAQTPAQNGRAADPEQLARTARDAAYWAERLLAVLAHAAVVAGLFLVGFRLFHDLSTGLAAGTLYLLLPYTAYHVGQIHHVWPTALVVWAVYLYRRPTWAGGLLGVAAGTTFFPLLLVPVWGQFYRASGLTRFCLGFACAWGGGVAVTIGALSYAGRFPDGMSEALHLADWQPWRVPTAESIWTGVNWAYRVPVFLLYALFVIGNFWWPRVRNLGHLVAVSAAVLIGIQFWFADRGGLYVLWYTPLLIILVLRPNVADLTPTDPGPTPAALARLARWLQARFGLGRLGAATSVPLR